MVNSDQLPYYSMIVILKVISQVVIRFKLQGDILYILANSLITTYI
jgi:hypothetical protein